VLGHVVAVDQHQHPVRAHPGGQRLRVVGAPAPGDRQRAALGGPAAGGTARPGARGAAAPGPAAAALGALLGQPRGPAQGAEIALEGSDRLGHRRVDLT
jgi:hypothetical protein